MGLPLQHPCKPEPLFHLSPNDLTARAVPWLAGLGDPVAGPKPIGSSPPLAELPTRTKSASPTLEYAGPT